MEKIKLPGILETERLTIRPFKQEDKPKFIEFMTDEESTRYLMFTDEQKTDAGASQLLDFIISSYSTEKPVLSLAIELKAGGYIGSCGISQVSGTIYECYYSLNREFWGNGYAKEATKAVIDHYLKDPKISAIIAYTSAENKRSIKVAEALGMESQGLVMHPVFKHEGLLYKIIK